MFGLLPDLAPRDSHSLWYTSSRNPLSSYDVQHHNHDPLHGTSQRRNNHIIERSPLARLRADEQNVERRLHNVSNFGSTWLKPPGIPKTLHQRREEQREQEEHQEALRREQLAQELAEAEAAGNGDLDAVLDGQGEDGMDDVQLDGARDLDDDIPAADADFDLSVDDDEDDSEEDDEDEDDDSDGDEEQAEQRATQMEQALMSQRMRVSERTSGLGFYGGEDEVDEEDQAQIIQEEDLVGDGDDGEMDMDANLDDDIPEAESAGGYEHTDSEAELSSSSDNDQAETSFVPTRAPQAARFRHSLARSDATRNSIAISDLLSHDGSSMIGSSPHMPRQAGPSSRSGHGRG